jgi:hypothetical protein
MQGLGGSSFYKQTLFNSSSYVELHITATSKRNRIDSRNNHYERKPIRHDNLFPFEINNPATTYPDGIHWLTEGSVLLGNVPLGSVSTS